MIHFRLKFSTLCKHHMQGVVIHVPARNVVSFKRSQRKVTRQTIDINSGELEMYFIKMTIRFSLYDRLYIITLFALVFSTLDS